MTETSQNILIRSRQFGEFTVEPHNIFIFEDGLLGFEDLHRYVLINSDQTAPFKWLLAVDEPEIGFPMLNPWFIDLGYKPGKKINPAIETPMVIVTLGSHAGEGITANMKAPVILNTENNTGVQVILTSEKYSTNQPLLPNNK